MPRSKDINETDQEATFRCISATMRIATLALDGLSLSDEDVEGLYDAVVQDERMLSHPHVRTSKAGPKEERPTKRAP